MEGSAAGRPLTLASDREGGRGPQSRRGARSTRPPAARPSAVLLAALLLVACACSPRRGESWRGRSRETIPLAPGQRIEAALDLSEARAIDFSLEVPETTVFVRIAVACRQAEVDVFARHGQPVEDPESADIAVSTLDGKGAISIGRFSQPALSPGRWWFQVAWSHDDLPRTADKRLARIPFEIAASRCESRVDGELVAGRFHVGRIDPERGGFSTLTIDVPRDARALRLDLTDVASDLDLFARPETPLLTIEEGVHFAQHFYGCESLLITPASEPPLIPGRWYVDVVDLVGEDRPISFKVHAGFDERPPEELLAIAALPAPVGEDPLARCLLAVVEIATDDGVGSGTIVSGDGWVLTNAHVVTAIGGEPVAEAVVSISLDPHTPPVESFRARVERIDIERDLALLRIVSGFYGQPLPAGYRFPTVALAGADALAIGEPLWLVGYPSTGGQGSRVTISATRGIVSGFDPADFGTVIKTDAQITTGNSGGAALDAQGRLVGVPTSMVESGSGHIGYVHPLSALPEAWRAQIGQESPSPR